jgi:hypothetical protein
MNKESQFFIFLVRKVECEMKIEEILKVFGNLLKIPSGIVVDSEFSWL